jgi:hypothetical protein
MEKNKDNTCTIEFRDKGPTHDKKPFKDFSTMVIGPWNNIQQGRKYELKPGLFKNGKFKGGNSISKKTELGCVEGIFDPEHYKGWFKKIEIHIRTNVPCKIIEVNRSKKLLPEDLSYAHGFPPCKERIGEDQISPWSLIVKSAQHWIVTDAPGTMSPWLEEYVFHREYTVTATFECGTKKSEKSLTYRILIKTNKKGEIESR